MHFISFVHDWYVLKPNKLSHTAPSDLHKKKMLNGITHDFSLSHIHCSAVAVANKNNQLQKCCRCIHSYNKMA